MTVTLSGIFTTTNIITIITALVAVGMLFLFQRTSKDDHKNMLAQLIIVLFIIAGVTYGLVLKDDDSISNLDIVLVDLIIFVAYFAIALLMRVIRQKNAQKETMTTRKLAFLGIIVGLASVLMLLGFPVLPGFHYLKVEISGLIIFMTLLWFDFKTAAIVSLITNFIHVFMPGTPPVIMFLDEGINFIATMIFILPTAILIKKCNLQSRRSQTIILWVSIASVVFTTVFMTLYNAFINLPLVYKMPLDFLTVLKVFGLFNLIKWGAVALVINLVWRRLYGLRNYSSYLSDEMAE
ncbi:MAG: ECF transporter S component [Bacilli bacterium]|nr:ECF transporter S component [Bacilli bacterium]